MAQNIEVAFPTSCDPKVQAEFERGVAMIHSYWFLVARRVFEGVLQQDPFTGHLFVFRGRTRANLIKIIYWDGTGFCLFTKRLGHGVFLWPPSVKPDETLSLTSVQLSLLIEGVDWRAPAAGDSGLMLRPIDS